MRLQLKTVDDAFGAHTVRLRPSTETSGNLQKVAGAVIASTSGSFSEIWERDVLELTPCSVARGEPAGAAAQRTSSAAVAVQQQSTQGRSSRSRSRCLAAAGASAAAAEQQQLTTTTKEEEEEVDVAFSRLVVG